jgi:hypothetical protein
MDAAENHFPHSGGSVKPSGGDLGLILGFAFAALVFHLLVNAFGGYGIFRDEFYYIACSKRLAAGYVDQPPLAMFLLAASRAVFGVSQVGIRVLPALSHALTILLGGLIARRLGGRRTAVLLACLAASLAPLIIGHTSIFQMNAFSHLFWALSAYLIVLIVDRGRPALWLLLGFVMGLGLLNKIDFLWFGVGLAAALLLTDMRKYLATPWPYAAAAIALLIFSPYIIWNITHDFGPGAQPQPSQYAHLVPRTLFPALQPTGEAIQSSRDNLRRRLRRPPRQSPQQGGIPWAFLHHAFCRRRRRHRKLGLTGQAGKRLGRRLPRCSECSELDHYPAPRRSRPSGWDVHQVPGRPRDEALDCRRHGAFRVAAVLRRHVRLGGIGEGRFGGLSVPLRN